MNIYSLVAFSSGFRNAFNIKIIRTHIEMSSDAKALTTVHNNTMARRMEHKADEKETKAISSSRKFK